MTFWRRLLTASSFMVLLLFSGWLYYKTQAVNIDLQDQFTPELRALKQLDVEWDANILKSRIGINNNYDPVTTPLNYVRNMEEHLGLSLQIDRGNTLSPALTKLKSIFNEKEELVEQFKSQNAILRNSLHYFPTAVEEFNQLLKHAVTKDSIQKRAFDKMEIKVNALLTTILRFNLTPDTDLERKVRLIIDAIEADIPGYPAELKESLTLMMKHARILLRQRMKEDELIAQITTASTTVQGMNDLSHAFDVEFQEVLREKQRYRTYSFIYSGLLLILLAYAAVRQAHSFKLIDQANKRLHMANETLEQRVAERTIELEKQSAQLAEMATHDTLTGLINRRQLMSHLERALLYAQRRARGVAVMFIDLDGFKAVNDRFGHAAGDMVLQEVARRVGSHIREVDSMARLGGDEFIILLDDLNAKTDAVRVAEMVLRQIESIIEVDGHAIKMSASIGIHSILGGQGMQYTPNDLLNQADQAMYQAKQRGKNCFCFSDEQAVC
jgi:diguanylate cyclase